MKSGTKQNTAWVLCVIALLLWGVVGYAAWYITGVQLHLARNVASRAQASVEKVSATRLHSILTSTHDQRQKLSDLLHMDVVSVVDVIEQTGKDSGVTVRITNTVPESNVVAGQKSVSGLAFVMQVQGSFDQLMHVVALLETLPLPSAIESLEFVHVSGSSSAPWNLNARIRVLQASGTSL